MNPNPGTAEGIVISDNTFSTDCQQLRNKHGIPLSAEHYLTWEVTHTMDRGVWTKLPKSFFKHQYWFAK